MPTFHRQFEAVDLSTREGKRYAQVVADCLRHIPEPNPQQQRWAEDVATIDLQKRHMLREAERGKLGHAGQVRLLGLLHKQQQLEENLGLVPHKKLPRGGLKHHLESILEEMAADVQ